ncbi:suppressor of fused domain protein [Mucilaginibacter rubeus]|uniref:Suppressor of fused domain protein n=1 Tax=Mucilaginibacter rubeus TaxID=2027860 RepID=A0A5C1HSZ0_9SPHI|nr:suppressor of fused domain protein [Mucilaginibacter rubeus]QEM09137.1 suppressor of fused domain protein [Mucilaginibacter rubeus]
MNKRKNMVYSVKFYKEILKKHYIANWGNNYLEKTWNSGPINKLSNQFTVLEFPPHGERKMWTYATCGMSTFSQSSPIELHIFSKVQDDSLLELLSSVVYFHNVDQNLNLEHTVNFGKPWQLSSICTYGLISLPYLDGPDLEVLYSAEQDKTIHCYWLIPITLEERDFKIRYGLEALEEIFDSKNFNYIDNMRQSVV